MRLLKWLIGLVITLGILLALTPLAAKWYLVRWLESQGYQAEIKNFGMDFIFGELRLQGMSLTSGKGEHLSVLDASADFDLWSLVRGRWVIDKLKVDSARLDVTRSDRGMLVGGFPLRQLSARLHTRMPVEVRSAEWTNTDICRTRDQCLRMETLGFSRSTLHFTGDTWSFAHNAPLTVQKVFLRDQTNTAALLFAGEFSLARGSYAPGVAKIEELTLSNFQFVESALADITGEAPYQTQVGELKLSSLQLRRGKEPQLILGKLDATSLRQSLHRNAEGKLELPPRLRRLLDRPDWAAATLVVESMDLRDGAASWMDYSVAPSATANLSAVQLQVSGLDSRLPQNPTQVKASGKVGQVGLFKLGGDIYPFSNTTQFTLSGFVQGLDLTSLAGYGRVLLDQGLSGGSVDASFSAVVRNQRVDADTRWQLNNLQLEPGRRNSAFLPLEVSYDLLKDHKSSVTFDLPLRGEVGSDRLTAKYVFATQMRRVLSDMAQRRVNPAGAVSSPAQQVRGGKMVFQPLTYAVSAHYPGEPDRSRVSEVAAMLRDKPHLSMVFCPITTGGEWAELFNQGVLPDSVPELLPEQHEALLNLAAARGRALRSHLIDAGATAEQISLCEPKMDLSQPGLSFVTISL
jgi:hypothetical protein